MPESGNNLPASRDLHEEIELLRARVKELEEFQTRVSHYRLLSEQVPAVLWSTDRDLRYTYVAGAGVKYTGIRPEDVLGRTLADVTGARDEQTQPMGEHMRALRGETVCYEFEWNGRVFRSQLEPMNDEQGRIIGTIGIGIDITDHIELEQLLRHRLAAESLLTSISTEFIAMRPTEIDEGIDNALRRVGHFAGADRVYVFSVTPDGRWCSNTHEWCKEGIASVIDDLQDIDLQTMPWWKGHLERLETIIIPDVSALPASALREREVLGAQGIRSLLAMPLAAGGRLIGFLGFDAVLASKTWTPEDAVLLRACGEVIAGALERRIADQALRESEAINRGLIQAVPDMLFRMDREGTILTCNVKDPSKLATPAEELLGKNLRDVGLSDVHELYVNAIANVLDTGRVQLFEYHSPRERGSRYWEVRVAQCSGDEVMALVRDITDRKRAELDLQERDRFLSSLISNLSGCVYRCRNDEDWSMEFISDGIETLLGYSTQEIVSQEQRVGRLIHPDDRQRVWHEVQDALQANRGFQTSYRILASDGEFKWVWERGSGVYASDGSLNAIEGFLTDITELKQAEESLKKSHSLLRLTLDEMDHRVRNNLASIAALLDITARRHETVSAFKDAVKARVHALAQVHNMLSRNRWVPSRLKDLVYTILPGDLESTIQADGPDVHLLPKQASALGMVLHELIANSLKYGSLRHRHGRLDVSWTCDQSDDGEQMVELTWCEDCGEAILPPRGHGLGTSLIEGIVQNDLRGRAMLGYQPNGANHRIVMNIESGSGENR